MIGIPTPVALGRGGRTPSAMWLWSLTPGDVDEVVAFVAERGVRTVFLGVEWEGPATQVVSLAHQLRTAGVQVQCLGGDLCWLEQPELALQWLERAMSSGVFDAVHLDVEPWKLSAWDRDPGPLVEQYVTLLGAVGGAGLPLEVDVAPRLAIDKAGTGHVLDAVLQQADRITVMAYRDHAKGPNGILDFSRAVRVACFRHAVSFRIGVETQPAAQAGGPGNTFAEEGRVALERETAVVSSELSANPFYLGVAVHDWSHWRQLL